MRDRGGSSLAHSVYTNYTARLLGAFPWHVSARLPAGGHADTLHETSLKPELCWNIRSVLIWGRFGSIFCFLMRILLILKEEFHILGRSLIRLQVGSQLRTSCSPFVPLI